VSTAVRLERLPCRLFWAAEEQWVAMLREYTLRGMGGGVQSYGADEITRAANSLSVVAEAVRDGAPSRTGAFSDEIAVANPGDFSVLQGILDEVRLLAGTGELLILPPLREVVSLRDWLCREIADQAAGATPSPWRLETDEHLPRDTEPPVWDRSLTPADDVAWLVGDDHNRLVAASPACLDLLGWEGDELVGQRLLAVIPHRLREAHIAGFTRSVVTGEGEQLGQPLALPALARDGREIPITLTLTRHPARAGRHVYLALLAPSA
jgi:PAS domain S-box-containing protein